MFLDKWIPKKYLAKKEICGIEVCFKDEGLFYYYTHLRNSGGKLELVETGVGVQQLVLPAAIVKHKTPLFVVINGKGVIVKKIRLEESSESSIEELLHQNLPAVTAEDFYVQLYRQADLSAFIVLCRKDQLDPVLKELSGLKAELADVLIGMPAIIGLQPVWSKFNRLAASTHTAELSNNQVESFSTADAGTVRVELEGMDFESSYSLGFAGALSYVMQRPLAENHSPELSAWRRRHTEKNKLRIYCIAAVAIAFVLAVGNVLLYTTWFDKNNRLETELSVYQGKYEQVSQLIADYQKNRDLIENAGVLGKNRLSEFADRIGETLPDEVVLSDLYFNPKLDDEDSEDSLVSFKNKQLILKGNCSKSFIVNEWINVLKMQKFIKDVSLEKFSYNNQGLVPNFEIRLVTE